MQQQSMELCALLHNSCFLQNVSERDEIGVMGYDSINNDVSVIKTNDCVEGIAFAVQRKSDAVPVTLMIWFDH
jgi:hypothetical protein